MRGEFVKEEQVNINPQTSNIAGPYPMGGELGCDKQKTKELLSPRVKVEGYAVIRKQIHNRSSFSPVIEIVLNKK